METVDEPQAPGVHQDRLLEGLARSIREKGLQGTQITDIVRNARTSRRTFYECFGDKESCFLELIDKSNLAVLAEMRAAIDPAASWSDQIEQGIDSYLGALARDAVLSATVSRELPTLGARGAALQQVCIDRAARIVVEVVDSPAMRRAGVRPISLQMALMLVGGITELVVSANLRGEEVRSVAPVAKEAFRAGRNPARGGE